MGYNNKAAEIGEFVPYLDRRKTPIRGFPDGTSNDIAKRRFASQHNSHKVQIVPLRARLRKRSVAYTLARIEVFFASGNPRQKSYFKMLPECEVFHHAESGSVQKGHIKGKRIF